MLTINNPTVFPLKHEEFPKYVRYMVYQKEKGASGTIHIQGYIELNKPQRGSSLRKWLGKQAYLEVARTDREFCYNYCTKEDTRLEGPITYGHWIDSKGDSIGLMKAKELIEKGATVDDILKEDPEVYARYKGVLKKTRTLHMFEKFKSTFIIPDLRQWQNELLARLDQEPDSRTVFWIYGSRGGEGKSTFLKYLLVKYGAYLVNGGRNEDIAYGYDFQNIVCLDFPRCVGARYDIIEHFKDGILFNQKYESHPMYFAPPHVVVASNVLPDYDSISRDRIVLINLDDPIFIEDYEITDI